MPNVGRITGYSEVKKYWKFIWLYCYGFL